MLESVVAWIVDIVHQWGYLGLFVMSFLESTFTPIPSEVTLIPAGYLIHQGKMHVIPVVLACSSGTMAGSWFTYWFAHSFGKRFIIRYGKYFLFPESKLSWVENYFVKHGKLSVFTGRLVPGVRHVISFPAGLANMPLSRFLLFTFAGSTLWMTVLLVLGYYIGENEALIKQYVLIIKLGALAAIPLAGGFYWWRSHRNRARDLKVVPTVEQE